MSVSGLFLLLALGGLIEQASLEKAIEAKNEAQIVQILKRTPSDANLRNANGILMLSLASQSDCAGCVKALLDAGADIKAKDLDSFGRTPLHWAAGWSTASVVRLLAEKGAPVNAKTRKGDTPLEFAKNNFYADSVVERRRIIDYLGTKGAR